MLETSMETEQSDASNDLASLAHAYLFVEGGTLSIEKLSVLMGIDEIRVVQALHTLASNLNGSGLTLIQNEREATLAVSEKESDALRTQYATELERDIGDAGLEVLTIILYRGPSTRAQIDYIRGVNTSSTMRVLLGRGLVERTGNTSSSREYIYRASAELLAHLGVANAQELPEYARLSSELQAFEEDSTLSTTTYARNTPTTTS